MVDLLLDALGVDWSRRWVQVRAAALLVLMLAFPVTFRHALMWWAHREAQQVVQQVQRVLPSLPPAPPAAASP